MARVCLMKILVSHRKAEYIRYSPGITMTLKHSTDTAMYVPFLYLIILILMSRLEPRLSSVFEHF